MLSDAIVKLFAPILLGVGAIIPVAIKASPFPFPPRIRKLVAVVFALTTWVAYFLTLGYAHLWLYGPWVTVSACLIAVILFVLVVNASRGKTKMTVDMRYFGAFVAAIFLLALASGNWIAQRGKVIVLVENSTEIRSVVIRKNGASTTDQIPINISRTKKKASVIFDDSEYAKIEAFYINAIPIRGLLRRINSGFPARRFLIQSEIP